MASGGSGGEAAACALGRTWQEMDAEGRQYVLHGKDRVALVAFDKAASKPGGCGWSVFANRAECKLHVLDFSGALDDAVLAMERQATEQRERPEPLPAPTFALRTAADALWREAELEDALVLASRLGSRRRDARDGGGASLIGDDRGQRVEGLRADIRQALGPAAGRVVRRDLLRAMLRHKGVRPRRLTAGPRLSWVTASGMQHGQHRGAPDTPLPLPIVWGVSPFTGRASDTEDAESEDDDEDEEMGNDAVEADERKDSNSENVNAERDGEGDAETDKEQQEVADDEAVPEDAAGSKSAKLSDAASIRADAKKKRTTSSKGEGEPPRWGWLRQIPGHDHVCADPLVAAQAARIAELRVLGQLERDRGYLRRLLGELESVQERPSDQRATDSGCPPCPGPNLTMWEDHGLRAEAEDSRQDPLAHSKWEAQDLCRKTLDDLNHMVKAELRCKPRYLHPTAGRGPSAQLRAERAQVRRERTLSTVRFMMRRLHDAVRSRQWRDAEPVGERLTEYLRLLPCKIFPGRLDALARVLDCRSVAARKRKNTRAAITLQKQRCSLAVEHGMTALYARALDELALLLFSVADYPLAETQWEERLSRLQLQLQPREGEEREDGVSEVQQRLLREEKVQVLFQLARCCFVQGYLRMAGPKASKQGAVRKDHRKEVQEKERFSLGLTLGQTISDLKFRSDEVETAADAAETGSQVEAEPYKSEWEDTCRWRLDLLNYDLGDDSDNVEPGGLVGPVELKPNSLEACLRIIMLEMETEDPVGEYGHLLAVERYPDMEDGGRKYPLMPADFNLEDNVMNKEYEVFEKLFRDACRYFVCEITGVSPDATDSAARYSVQPSSAAPPPEAAAEGPMPPEPETERLPSVTEEPEARGEE